MLPALRSIERDALHRQAVSIAIEQLEQERGHIANALYKTYMAFRLRFLAERDLMDVVPGCDAASIEALEDARLLEFYVRQRWASIILAAEGRS